jgi:hypothetical protein
MRNRRPRESKALSALRAEVARLQAALDRALARERRGVWISAPYPPTPRKRVT